MKKVFLFACVALIAAMVVSCGEKKKVLEGEAVNTRMFSLIVPNGYKWTGSNPDKGLMILKLKEDGKSSEQGHMSFNVHPYRQNAKLHEPNELKDAAEKGSALEQQITALQDKLRESERHANFVDGAAGAGCTNAKAAYKLAKADADLWKRDGTPDWAAIKETAPEFFQKAVKAAGNAGSGTNINPNAGGKMHPMDELMRRSIGIL